MKKQIGNTLALYPTPLVIIGTMVNEKPNWMPAGHVGIIGHEKILISLAKSHYTNRGIHETGKLSVSIVDRALLPLADLAGCLSGNDTDKSGMFSCSVTDAGVPIIDQAPVVMECTAEDIYPTDGFESFICRIDRTYAEEDVLDENGKISYQLLKPVLFEMPTYEYLVSGEVIGKCRSLGRKDGNIR